MEYTLRKVECTFNDLHDNNKRVIMAKKIYVEEKAKAHLRRVFKCSNVMVWKALTFESDSELARKIRYVALSQLGGVANWEAAEVETTHEEVARTMTQHFGPRVSLVYYKEDDRAVVLVDGHEEKSGTVGSIENFVALQNEVQSMAMSL